MSDELVEETQFFPTLIRLAACLQAELDAAKGPGRCFDGIVPEGRPPLGVMDCKSKECGVSWVSPVSVFPSTAFPAPDGEGGDAPTAKAPLAMEVQIGVARCYPTPKGRDAQADAQEYLNATRLYLSDMAAVRRAILCCFRPEHGQPPPPEVAIGTWTPLEPEARASGGTWQLWIR